MTRTSSRATAVASTTVRSSQHLAEAMALLTDGVGVVSARGQLLEANPPLRALLRTRGDGTWLRDAVHADDQVALEQLLQTRDRGAATLRLVDRRGLPTSHEVRAAALDDGRLLLEFRDVTQDLLVRAQLRETRSRLAQAFEAAPFGMALCSSSGTILEPNPRMVQLLGGSSVRMLGRPLWTRVGVEHRDAVRTACASLVLGAPPVVVEARTEGVNASWLALSLALVAEDHTGSQHILVQAQDVSRAKLAQTRLEHDAVHDALTGLANRVLLHDRLDHAMRRRLRDRGEVAVLFVDLNRFNHVNETHGHHVGDAVLQRVAGHLQVVLRDVDTVARVGGDEFVCVLENLDGGVVQALEIAARVQESLTLDLEGQHWKVMLSASVGVAMATDDHTAAQLLQEADAAMYVSKRDPNAGPALFDEGLRAAALARVDAERELRGALADDDGVVTLYQPIIDLQGGRLVAAEALVRLRGADGGLIPPFRFLEVAEDTGLIVPLGARVLRTAMTQTAMWRARHPEVDFRISINVSLRQLEPGFVPLVRAALQETGLPPASVCLEITESMLLDAAPRAQEVLAALHDLGVRLALDDFGTGASSLTHLRSFPVDVLKADRSFVGSATTDPLDLAIVQAVVDLGDRLHKDVVAEGIETAADLAMLLSVGARYAQGYLFGRPMLARDFDRLLAADAARDHADDELAPPDLRAAS